MYDNYGKICGLLFEQVDDMVNNITVRTTLPCVLRTIKKKEGVLIDSTLLVTGECPRCLFLNETDMLATAPAIPHRQLRSGRIWLPPSIDGEFANVPRYITSELV